MINVFEATENSISKHKKRNKVLQNEADRLLEHVLNADILSMCMNSLYLSGTSMLIDDHNDGTEFLRKQNQTLRCENEQLLKQSDDVKTKFLNDICQLNQKLQWCQKQSLDFELQLQSQNASKECQKCTENVILQSQLWKYVKEIDALKVETLEWQQTHIDSYHKNRSLASDLQDQNHIIIELKEKINVLEKGKFVSTQVLAPGLYKIDRTTSETIGQTPKDRKSVV